MMPRVGVFVNINNQVSTLESKKRGYRINYAEYLTHVLDKDDDLIVAIAYGSFIADEAKSFIYVLKKLGYITKFVQSTCSRNVEMTMDMLLACKRLDKIVIGSNDPDLIPIITHFRSIGVKVIVASPYVMHSEASEIIELSKNETVVEYIQTMRDRK